MSGNGKQTAFKIPFAQAFAYKPIVLLTTNQFARSRLLSVAADSFTVEFESAPKAGKDNITIWWMAQE